jgi:hypothetical protein
MSRIQFVASAPVLALGYMAANAVDAALADLPRLTRMIDTAGLAFLQLPALIAVLLLLFGGLPLAVFGLLLERQWAGVRMEWRRYVRVSYAVLVFQIVSMAFSGLWLVLTGPDFLWALSSGFVHLSDWLWPGYLAAQILASIVVIPVWRRVLLKASENRTGVLLLNRT